VNPPSGRWSSGSGDATSAGSALPRNEGRGENNMPCFCTETELAATVLVLIDTACGEAHNLG
jgi:hypothetical protein